MKNAWMYTLVICSILFGNGLDASGAGAESTAGNKTGTPYYGGGIHIFKFDFRNVETPFVVCCWVLLASLAKIGLYCITHS